MKCLNTDRLSQKECFHKLVLTMKLPVLLSVFFSLAMPATGFPENRVNLEMKKNSYWRPVNGTGLRAAQDVVVTGKVVDPKGEPLIGVSIKIKGTTKGVSTDVEGNFKISTNPNAVLTVAYVGYETIDFPLKGQRTVRIALKESVSQLDEVVVVGYGAVRKRDVTGAVGTVSAEELTAKGTTSVMNALQGEVAGVNITTNSTRPGSSFSIQIRGQNTMNSGATNPLYVVDGIVMDNIDFLNPADIEKIDILKDASSTAIYGSRGSNGVVLVTTRGAGSVAKTMVSYDGYYGIRSLARIPDFMDGREWVKFRTSAYYTYAGQNYTLKSSDQKAILQNSRLLQQRLYDQDYTDWLDLGTQQGRQQNHYVNISGLSNKLSYNFGLGYQNEKGNFVKEELNKYNTKLSVNNKISDKLTIGANATLAHQVVGQGSQYGYRDIMRMPVILNAYDTDGNIIRQPGIGASIEGDGNFTSSGNPLIEINSGNQEVRRFDVLGSAFLQFTPVEGLEFKTTFMPNFNRTRTGYYYGLTPERTQDVAYQENEERFEYTWDNQITYKKTINKDHNINATLINSWYKTRYETIEASAQNLPYNSEWYNLFSGTFVPGNSRSWYSETSLLSYAARVNYDYKGKYLVTGTLRYDGSSKLADKWKGFPSFALAWRAGEEEFLKTPWLSDLKFRFSFGYSGSNSGIDPYTTQLTPVTDELVWYDFGGSQNVVSGFSPGTPVNTNITWEKTREIDLGVDFGFFNQRLFGSADYYNKLSDGLLLQRSLALESGVASMTDNIGSVRNKGVEFSLTSLNIRSKDLQWSTTLNLAYNKNEIVTLYGRKQDVVAESRFIGQPINVIYDYRVDGIWKQSEAAEAMAMGQQPGQARPVDVNGDGLFTSDDRTILGQVDPKWTGGISSSLTFRNWDFSFNVFGRQGTFVNDNFLAEFGAANAQRGRPKIDFDYYVPQNVPRYDWSSWNLDNGYPLAVWGNSGEGHEDAKYPAINNQGAYYGNNGRYTKADFIKVRNISLGYTFSKKMLAKVKLNSLRIYANVLNPFTFTSYEGWDPEFATTSLQNGNGPSNVTYQFGVNLKF